MPPRWRPTIRVTLQRVEGQGEGSKTRLRVADDGIGFTSAGEGGHGLGTHLLEMLAKQIGASLRTVHANGTAVEIEF